MYSSATYASAVETGWRWLTTTSLVFFSLTFLRFRCNQER
jgi:hypothetical protein